MFTRNEVISAIKVVDAMLDTMVFGRPLGLFGEKLQTNEAKPTSAPAPACNCAGQPRDNKGRFCKVEVKVAQPKPEESKYSVIGKRMKIETDEYTYTKSGADGYIAGKPLTILSEPFIDDSISEDVELVKVMSEETGREYICEFRETWFI